MHKYCGHEHEQLLACHYPHCMCHNCCGATSMLPRSCASCTWPRQNKHGEWRCCTRCSNEIFKTIFKRKCETRLCRCTQRAPKQPASMMNLHTAKPLEEPKTAPPVKTTIKQKTKKKPQKITWPAEIIIERPAECKGGYLRALAKTPNCHCRRMRALLLQQALCNECNCDPFDLLPSVPLTFYPKWRCRDNTKMCNEDSMAKLLSYISTDGQCCLTVKRMLSKDFLTGLNQLYANVGGGKNGAFGFEHYLYGPADREYEFEGFFGKLTRRTFKLPLSNVRNTHLEQPRGWTSLTGSSAPLKSTHRFTRYKSQKGSVDVDPHRRSFLYPTKILEGERQHLKTSQSQILKYLTGRNSSEDRVAA